MRFIVLVIKFNVFFVVDGNVNKIFLINLRYFFDYIIIVSINVWGYVCVMIVCCVVELFK